MRVIQRMLQQQGRQLRHWDAAATQAPRRTRCSAHAEDLCTFRAQCHPGLEEVVANELRSMPASSQAQGISFIPTKAGVDFRGPSVATAYHACMHLRAAIRVLHQLGTHALDPHGDAYDELYAAVQHVAPWHEHVRPGMTLAVELRMRSCTGWNHSTVAQQCIQSAIADAVRARGCVASANSRLQDSPMLTFVERKKSSAGSPSPYDRSQAKRRRCSCM